MTRLAGRAAIVTGGGAGIGHGIARRFAAEGAKVLIADIDLPAAESVANEIAAEFGAQAKAIRTDVRNKEDVLAMAAAAKEAWGKVDILVNNAWGGTRAMAGVENKTDEQMAHGFGLAFHGPFWAMQAVYPSMKKQRWGRVINICSLGGVNAFMGTLEYNAAKEALRTLTRTAAREWAPFGVTANAICPGAKSAALKKQFEQRPEMQVAMDAANPMGRVGDPEFDVAPVALFLASEDSRYVTGNTLFADGGGHINGVQWDPGLPEQRTG
jgi:NAD(P)-dependent dehydrogenase (short-subunit alcohol dehydrogenase family)